MRFVQEFRDPAQVLALADSIRSRAHRRARLMEFCGGHTVAVLRHGLRQLMPEAVELVSGPGCPVCVTPMAEIDLAISFASLPGVIVTTFGDLFKVPGSRGSLQQARAEGADVRMVYSPADALDLAAANPASRVVFLGIGFETTAPTVAAAVLMARQRGIGNFLVHSMHKLCPPILEALLGAGGSDLQGLICPGHVSAVTGARAWQPVADRYGIPCVVAGFEPADILQAVAMLVDQVEAGQARVEIAYRRGVTWEGNRHAQQLCAQVFEPCSARWRGVGQVEGSGLALREEFAAFDASRVLGLEMGTAVEPPGCICGAILRGQATPGDCRLFGGECTPEQPVGPCMVSSEGSCAAFFAYGREGQTGRGLR